jgi:hypothetical protein
MSLLQPRLKSSKTRVFGTSNLCHEGDMSTTWFWLLGAAGVLYLLKVTTVMITGLMERGARPRLSDTLATITERPLAIAFLALVISAALVFGLTQLFFGYDKPLFQNIMVEAHGMLLDILVIGLFILWLNKLGEKRLENKRYQDEIDDFRRWHSEEAAYRIAGNIKRLNRNGISKIVLEECYLAHMVLRRANLQGAELRWATLLGARLMGADLRGSKNLTEEQVRLAHINESTMLPDYLKKPRL